MPAVVVRAVLLTFAVLAVLTQVGPAHVRASDDDDSKAWADVIAVGPRHGLAVGVDKPTLEHITAGLPSGTLGDATATTGHGDGGQPECTASPVGPVAEIQAAVAAAAAEQVPTVSDPTFTEDVISPQGPLTRVVTSTWYRWDGQFGEIKVIVTCPGRAFIVWSALGAGPDGMPVPQITAADLLPGVHAEVIRHLPTPIPRIGPADENPYGWTYVNNRTFFWIDQAQGQWAPVVASVSAAGITVSARAEPVTMVVDPGDGNPKITCAGAGVAVTKDTWQPEIPGGCPYIYPNSSAMAPNGETYPVTIGMVWHVTWSATTGEGGDLGYVSTTSEPRDLAVAEVQAIIVPNG
jgi:hypothetical protein